MGFVVVNTRLEFKTKYFEFVIFKTPKPKKKKTNNMKQKIFTNI